MTIDIERIKLAVLIEDVIGETHPLTGNSRYRKGAENDSLVVDVEKQYYFWNSSGHNGDVISWLENTRRWSFRQAIEWLADRAGIPMVMDERQAAAYMTARRRSDVLTVVAEFLQAKFAATPAATAYAESRGWPAQVAADAGLGFWDGDRKGLTGHLQMHDIEPDRPEVVGVLGWTGDVVEYCKKWAINVEANWLKTGRIPGMPAGIMIYPHYVGARVEYLSGRSIEGKAHYNLSATLVEGKRPYYNRAYNAKSEHVVVVEGQADALSLGMWGIPAVALAGVSSTNELLKRLKEHDNVYVALDMDAAGNKAIRVLAEALGPMTRIVAWPAGDDGEPCKDANDWLLAGGSGAECRRILGDAPIFAEWLARAAAAADPLAREKLQRQAMEIIAKLPDYVLEARKRGLAEAMGLAASEFNGMLKALKKENATADAKIEMVAPNGRLDDHVFEMVYEEDKEKGPRTAFAVRYPDGRISTTPRLETDNYRIAPFDPHNSLLSAKVVRLPTRPEGYDTEAALLRDIQSFIHKYVDTPDHIEKLASYYIMMTWVYDSFYVLPYLRARGDSDSGKSRFTEVVGELCLRAIFVTGSTTPSPVFRLMTMWNGMTLVMDEADLPHSETSADWVQMFNTGYKDGFAILRSVVKNGEILPEAFSGFGPKIINMRGKFTDDATESRCLTWETASGRGIRGDIPRYMDREEFNAEASRLRNQLLMFRLRNLTDVEVDYNHEATKHLPGRLVEITVPLMSISKDTEFKESVMDFMARMNKRAVGERQSTLEAKVLEAIFRAWYLPDEKAQEAPDALKMQVAHITRQANFIINRENAESILEDEEDSKFAPNRQLNGQRVGKIIGDKLNLETNKATIGTRPKVLPYEDQMDRLNALIIRYGLEDVVMDMAMEAQRRAAAAEAAEAKGTPPHMGVQGSINL